jgi:ABC-type nitrate/sulfonate/bicarbonate transport system permease component
MRIPLRRSASFARPTRFAPGNRILVAQIAVGIVWLGLWEVVGRQNPTLLSYPSQVFATLWRLGETGRLGDQFLFTARTFVLGWAISIVLGIAIGSLVGASRPVALMFEPTINGLYATPKLVLIPLLILWFGLELKAYVASVVIGAVFPVIVMTITGVRNAGREYVEVARSFRVKGLPLLWKVVIPGALPFIFVGLRLSMGRALGGAIAAEFLLAGPGIGTAVLSAGHSLAAAPMYGYLMLIVASAMVIDIVGRRAWRLVTPPQS